MKTFNRSLIVLGFFLCLVCGRGQAGDPDKKSDTDAKTIPATVAPAVKVEAPTGEKLSTNTNAGGGLRLNFRGVPLELVLDYLSEAAGFIIIKETDVKGKVDVWSNQVLSKDEAVDLLNTMLNANGYAAIRDGRKLTIVSREDAKKRGIPVKKGGEAGDIPRSDQMVTQIIPVKRATAAQLTKDLEPLLASYATMTANESANTLVLTATESDVKRMTEIVNALDESISGTSTIKVFPMRYADAKELATVLKDLFQPSAQQGNNRGQGGFGGFGGGVGGFGGVRGGQGGQGGQGGAGGGAAGGATGRGTGASGTRGAATQVVAVADERSNSLVVSAPEDTMESIARLVKEIDVNVADVTELRVFHLVNADPIEMSEIFSQLFPDDTKTGADQNQNPFGGLRFNRGGPFGGPQNAQTAQTAGSDRAKKKGRVVAVPDQRTASIIVTAASEMMPQIAEMVSQLDANPAKKQKVFVYSLENADVQQVEQILRDVFDRNNLQGNRSGANQNSALSTRSQNNQNNNGNTGIGTTGQGNSGGPGGGTGQLGR